MRAAAARIIAFAILVVAHTVSASGLHPEAKPSDPEQQLIRALDLFKHGDAYVDISDVSIYAYPDEKNLIEVGFQQQYRGDRFKSHARKVQYWREGANGAWQIVAEEAATGARGR